MLSKNFLLSKFTIGKGLRISRPICLAAAVSDHFDLDLPYHYTIIQSFSYLDPPPPPPRVP